MQTQTDKAKRTPNSSLKGTRSAPEETRLQGHWLLAKMGKRVLRPGGLELSKLLIKALNPQASDRIIEFGPGVGSTAQVLLQCNPRSYIGIDPFEEGNTKVKKVISPYAQARLVKADAKNTGLPTGQADLIIGEAMLTMQSETDKLQVIKEAYRLLAPGGRYGIHELGFVEDLTSAEEKTITKALSRSIKVGARPLKLTQWQLLLEQIGFQVEETATNKMLLLEPKRIFADEGFIPALRFFANVVRNPPARKRIIAMRKLFRQHAAALNAVALVAVKPK